MGAVALKGHQQRWQGCLVGQHFSLNKTIWPLKTCPNKLTRALLPCQCCPRSCWVSVPQYLEKLWKWKYLPGVVFHPPLAPWVAVGASPGSQDLPLHTFLSLPEPSAMPGNQDTKE